MPTNDQLAMLRAMVEGDFEWRERLTHLLHASGGLDGYAEVIAAAFFIAVRKQFPERYCADDMIRLVADTRTLIDLTGDLVDPRAAELVAHSALGKHGLIREISGVTVVLTQIVITSYLALEGRLGDPDAFMRIVEAQLDKRPNRTVAFTGMRCSRTVGAGSDSARLVAVWLARAGGGFVLSCPLSEKLLNLAHECVRVTELSLVRETAHHCDLCLDHHGIGETFGKLLLTQCRPDHPLCCLRVDHVAGLIEHDPRVGNEADDVSGAPLLRELHAHGEQEGSADRLAVLAEAVRPA